MYKYSEKSKERLKSVHPYLQLICNKLIEIYDCTIIEGYRNEEKQNNYFNGGKSKFKFPDSKHNRSPFSLAVDVSPFPIDWNNRERFVYMAGLIKGIASIYNLDIRWGGDWDSDNDLKDQNFNDLPHFELK